MAMIEETNIDIEPFAPETVESFKPDGSPYERWRIEMGHKCYTPMYALRGLCSRW